MKALLFLAALSMTISFQAMAHAKILSKCSVNIHSVLVRGKYVIKSENGRTYADITTTVGLIGETQRVEVKVTDYEPVRAGIIQGYDMDADEKDHLTYAENYVDHALWFEVNPNLSRNTKFTVDLRAVRFAKIYEMVGEAGESMGALVETKDANGRALGTFFSGLDALNCR